MQEDTQNTEIDSLTTNVTEQTGEESNKRMRLLTVCILITLAFSGIAGYFLFTNNDVVKKTSNDVVLDGQLTVLDQETVTSLENIEIIAIAGSVYDPKSERFLYQKNSTEIVPLASLTKIMTALVAYEILGKDTIVTISDEALAQDGDSGFRIGEQFTSQNLIDLTLQGSSNDGAFALAQAAGQLLEQSSPAVAFVKAMNIRAKELGLINTYFRNPTGLDISETEAGAYGTATDVSLLMSYVAKKNPMILEKTTVDFESYYNTTGQFHTVNNTNPKIETTLAAIGSKTGYTELAGGNLSVVVNLGLQRPIVVTVLQSTYQDRFNDVSALIQSSVAELAN